MRRTCNSTTVQEQVCTAPGCGKCDGPIRNLDVNVCSNNQMFTCNTRPLKQNVTASISLFSPECRVDYGVKNHYFGKCDFGMTVTCQRSFSNQLGLLSLTKYKDDKCEAQVDTKMDFVRGTCSNSSGMIFRMTDCRGYEMNQFAALGIVSGVLGIGLIGFFASSVVFFIFV